eukprot:1187921-Prorocentrum_minimum.AAC.6
MLHVSPCREVLNLLKDIPLDEAEEASSTYKAAASDCPAESTEEEKVRHDDTGVSDREAESDVPQACAITAEEVGSLVQAIEDAVSKPRSVDPTDDSTASTAPDGDECEEEGSTVPESPSTTRKARAPRTERVNEWDRDVYGVDDFDDGMIDDFELLMGSALDDEFSSMRSELVNFKFKKADMQDHNRCELSELD